MSETPTPRTDAYLATRKDRDLSHTVAGLSVLARDLERELTAERAARERAEAENEQIRIEAEASKKDAKRWYSVWEYDLRMHRLNDHFWCSRVDYIGTKYEYEKCATREEAIDAAIAVIDAARKEHP